MFDELKNKKRIRDMYTDETGYILHGGIVTDENFNLYLNLNSLVFNHYIVFAYTIKKMSNNLYDYEVEKEDFFLENFYFHPYIHSGELKKNRNYIKLDYLPANIKEKENDEMKDDNEERRFVLEPLKNIFFNRDIINEIILKTGIPEILNLEDPTSNGIILYGRPGTGKSTIQKAIAKVYDNLGFFSKEINLAKLTEMYVGALGNNLDEEIEKILEEAKSSPVFIYLDEASSLVTNSKSHGSTSDYYQEGIDVLKKYISNYSNLVFSITTNSDVEDFDLALIREGRLTPIKVPYPGENEIKKMWNHFIEKYKLFESISSRNINELTKICLDKSGAFVDNFCKIYLNNKMVEINEKTTKSENIVEALIYGEFISVDDIRKTVTYKKFKKDLITEVESRKEKITKPVGFN